MFFISSLLYDKQLIACFKLFGHPNEEFPVIISLVGPEDDLSIQVHLLYDKQLIACFKCNSLSFPSLSFL